ncbi:hypothetical protein M8J75_008449 [Diaphorina citri]|nr:hypothetical protein M8J75_008449 [Diaphorina citri]
MSSRLTCTGLLWTLLSLLAAVTSCAGFFSSSWLEGVLFDPAELRDVSASMSSFRRCNYPQLNIDGQSYIALSCGRYSRFMSARRVNIFPIQCRSATNAEFLPQLLFRQG